MGERNDGDGQPTRQEALRRLRRVVDAAAIIEDELRFQVMRLEKYVAAKTDEERQHHTDLKAGYELSEKYVKRLRRYHESRIGRIETGQIMRPATGGDEAFEDVGETVIASPYLDDEKPV